ncbi:hypothetical protein B0H67DRAFT_593113 [Lasiosphaeris hirsuta]|uniref:Uncharacterized protein n=1 Tax=Lasiosphaeris hirsuta TaxID=260670 RepID=A0AA40DKY1_9PEZI|nr:hypothetical protein B0H67DRAFT_593113 [Lasiosphaeris hirsuta]
MTTIDRDGWMIDRPFFLSPATDKLLFVSSTNVFCTPLPPGDEPLRSVDWLFLLCLTVQALEAKGQIKYTFYQRINCSHQSRASDISLPSFTSHRSFNTPEPQITKPNLAHTKQHPQQHSPRSPTHMVQLCVPYTYQPHCAVIISSSGATHQLTLTTPISPTSRHHVNQVLIPSPPQPERCAPFCFPKYRYDRPKVLVRMKPPRHCGAGTVILLERL